MMILISNFMDRQSFLCNIKRLVPRGLESITRHLHLQASKWLRKLSDCLVWAYGCLHPSKPEHMLPRVDIEMISLSVRFAFWVIMRSREVVRGRGKAEKIQGDNAAEEKWVWGYCSCVHQEDMGPVFQYYCECCHADELIAIRNFLDVNALVPTGNLEEVVHHVNYSRVGEVS